MTHVSRLALAFLTLAVLAAPAAAQMDLSQASGVPLPTTDVPVGTVSVRVVRQSFANNVMGADVVFTIDGQDRTIATGDDGRAQVSGLAPGTTVIASVTVDGETLRSQPITIGASGIRVVLVAGLGATAAAGPAQPGTVAFGPNSRIVAEYSNERLNVYYVLEILNPASTPVDLGGPLVVELPRSVRGAAVIDGTTAQATVSGAHVTALGPFAPGVTQLNVAFELPFDGSTAILEQTFPVAVQRLTVFALQNEGMDMRSPQFSTTQATSEQGQPLIVGLVSAQPKDATLAVTITGLPHHATWPRNVALALGGALVLLGILAAVVPASGRAVA